MRISFKILTASLVKPFYRHNAGFFLFIFLVFFGVVAPSHQLYYHYSLIRGLLESPLFLGIVLLAWLLYAAKCHQWVISTLAAPEYSFLNILSRLDKKTAFRLLLGVQLVLYLPVWSYSLAITGVAFFQGRPLMAIGVQGYVLFLCLVTTARYQFRLYRPGFQASWLAVRLPSPFRHPPYWSFFMRYLLLQNKVLLAGIKLSGCAILYGLLSGQDADHYEIRMPFLIFSMILFGHGVLIYRCRELEEKRLLFYRSLPVPLLRRFGQVTVLYLALLVPEICTIAWLTPVYLHWMDAIGFVVSGYGLLLLLNSILYFAPLAMSEFLKLSGGIFGILYLGVLGGVLIPMGGLFFLLAGCLFLGGYWRYQR